MCNLDTWAKQEHPRGSIVEPQGLHQDGPNIYIYFVLNIAINIAIKNSLPYNSLKPPIIATHVYDIF